MTVLSAHLLAAPLSGTRARLRETRARIGAQVHRTTDRLESPRSQTVLLVTSSSVGLVAVGLSGFGLLLLH